MTRQVHGLVQQADDPHGLVVEPIGDHIRRRVDPMRRIQASRRNPQGVEPERRAVDRAGARTRRVLAKIGERGVDQAAIAIGRAGAVAGAALPEQGLDVAARATRDIQPPQAGGAGPGRPAKP